MSTPINRLSRAQVRELDKRAIERYQIPGIVLMENAARGAAMVAWDMLGKQPGKLVDIVCGGGNNGGDGLAMARHLHNLGCWVNVIPAQPPAKWTGDAQANWKIFRSMQLDCARPDEIFNVAGTGAELIVDALFGTGLEEAPRDDAAKLIEAMNASGRQILAVDVPSGLDCDTGKPLGAVCIRAARTATFVAEKAGFANAASKQYTGEVVVVDIGSPRELVEIVRGEAK